MASVQSTGRPMYYWNGTTWVPIASVIGDTEVIQDVAADLFDHLYHDNITVTYDDANGRLILSAQGSVVSVNGQSGSVQLTTTDIPEGTNLYFTDSRALLATASTIASASAAAVLASNLYVDSVLPTASAAAVSATRWKYKGAYDNGADYAIDDVVTYATSLWIRIGEPNPGYAPYEGSPYWQLLAITNVDLSPYLTEADASAIYHTTASATASVAYLEELISQLYDSISPSSASATASRITAYVKNGTTPLAIGTPVYITGSDGTNIIVGPASNSSESTSSKTFGFTQTALSANQHGYIVLQGELEGLDTSSANDGDPIWLGNTPGTVIYGLANKPSAPNHLVFLGVVSRSNQNNGEIFVSIQNGFELQELHNVRITSASAGNILQYNSASSLWINTPLITTTVPEGTNLYFTDERAQDAVAAAFASGSHTGITVTYNDETNSISLVGAANVTDEQVQDAVAPLFTHNLHNNVTVTYNDNANKIILSAAAGGGGGTGDATMSWWMGV